MRGASNKDPFGDPEPAKRATEAKQAVDEWLADVPAGPRRESAGPRLHPLADVPAGPRRESAGPRLHRLLDPKPEEAPAESFDWNAFIAERSTAWTDASDRELADVLGALGCAAGQAPNVARGLLRRMNTEVRIMIQFRLRFPYHLPLAQALLAPNCAGSKDLTEEEHGTLTKFAAGELP